MNDLFFEKTQIPGVYIVHPSYVADERGYFSKDFNQNIFSDNGIQFLVKETYYSFSKTNVLRGLHFQTKYPQAKLTKCLIGSIFDVAVDLRFSSPTYGKWVGQVLSAENKLGLFVPEGFAHGFLALEPSFFEDKCSQPFFAQGDGGVLYSDKEIGIRWPTNSSNGFVVSEKDKRMPNFCTLPPHLFS